MVSALGRTHTCNDLALFVLIINDLTLLILDAKLEILSEMVLQWFDHILWDELLDVCQLDPQNDREFEVNLVGLHVVVFNALEDKSEWLVAQASTFRREARGIRRQLCCRNLRLACCLCTFFIMATALAVLSILEYTLSP